MEAWSLSHVVVEAPVKSKKQKSSRAMHQVFKKFGEVLTFSRSGGDEELLPSKLQLVAVLEITEKSTSRRWNSITETASG